MDNGVRSKIAVALDVPTMSEALELAKTLQNQADYFKIGSSFLLVRVLALSIKFPNLDISFWTSSSTIYRIQWRARSEQLPDPARA